MINEKHIPAASEEWLMKNISPPKAGILIYNVNSFSYSGKDKSPPQAGILIYNVNSFS